MRHILALAIAASFTSAAIADETGISLRVDIDGARPESGQILATLFASEATYMKAPLAETTAPIQPGGTAILTFENLPAGDYAMSVIHDKNGNGKLDTGLFRIPKEKIGFSNNAKGRMGPAPWDKARFDLTETTANIRISLRKAKR